MKRLKLIKLNKAIILLKKLPRILGKNAFLGFLVFLFLSVIIGGLVLYQYSFSIDKIKPEVSESVGFKEKTYQRVLGVWQEKEERFEETNSKEYPNPFQELTE